MPNVNKVLSMKENCSLLKIEVDGSTIYFHTSQEVMRQLWRNCMFVAGKVGEYDAFAFHNQIDGKKFSFDRNEMKVDEVVLNTEVLEQIIDFINRFLS